MKQVKYRIKEWKASDDGIVALVTVLRRKWWVGAWYVDSHFTVHSTTGVVWKDDGGMLIWNRSLLEFLGWERFIRP